LVGHLLHGRYAVWTSSGTSGHPGIFLHDIGALAVYEALETLRFRGLSFAEYGARLMAGERFALVMVTGGHFASISSIEHLRRTFPWLAANVAPFSLFTPLPQLVEQLNAFQPTLLASYPTGADVLAGEQEAGRLKLRLAELWTGGESLAPCVKDRLEKAFGCRVRNEYGASECLSIAWECPHGVLHAHADFVLLEPVDANFQPVPPGTPSHSVLLTNLANRVQPIIRYDLGDSITLLPPCRCGSSMPAIRVEGRRDDTLCFAGAHRKAVELLPLVLTTVMEDEAGVFDFQLRQTDERTLRVVLGEQATEARPHVRKVLRAFLARCALAHVAVEFDSAPPLRNSTSGKLRRVVRVQTGARPA
jgi:phenylacetate-coenzyme A ligase PaaK-like adenylate-forming protein